jgi:arylsulfatase A-like enzyme
MNIFLSCVAALISFSVAGANDEAPPNVLIIMTDEHNLRTLGCYRDLMVKSQAEIWGEGVTVATPNINSLAKNGALFSNFMTVSPQCTPSRGSFLTGTYPNTHAAVMNNVPMSDDAITFAQTMKEKLGYATSYMGKVSVLPYSCIAVYASKTSARSPAV